MWPLLGVVEFSTIGADKLLLCKLSVPSNLLISLDVGLHLIVGISIVSGWCHIDGAVRRVTHIDDDLDATTTCMTVEDIPDLVLDDTGIDGEGVDRLIFERAGRQLI